MPTIIVPFWRRREEGSLLSEPPPDFFDGMPPPSPLPSPSPSDELSSDWLIEGSAQHYDELLRIKRRRDDADEVKAQEDAERVWEVYHQMCDGELYGEALGRELAAERAERERVLAVARNGYGGGRAPEWAPALAAGGHSPDRRLDSSVPELLVAASPPPPEPSARAPVMRAGGAAGGAADGSPGDGSDAAVPATCYSDDEPHGVGDSPGGFSPANSPYANDAPEPPVYDNSHRGVDVVDGAIHGADSASDSDVDGRARADYLQERPALHATSQAGLTALAQSRAPYMFEDLERDGQSESSEIDSDDSYNKEYSESPIVSQRLESELDRGETPDRLALKALLAAEEIAPELSVKMRFGTTSALAYLPKAPVVMVRLTNPLLFRGSFCEGERDQLDDIILRCQAAVGAGAVGDHALGESPIVYGYSLDSIFKVQKSILRLDDDKALDAYARALDRHGGGLDFAEHGLVIGPLIKPTVVKPSVVRRPVGRPKGARSAQPVPSQPSDGGDDDDDETTPTAYEISVQVQVQGSKTIEDFVLPITGPYPLQTTIKFFEPETDPRRVMSFVADHLGHYKPEYSLANPVDLSQLGRSATGKLLKVRQVVTERIRYFASDSRPPSVHCADLVVGVLRKEDPRAGGYGKAGKGGRGMGYTPRGVLFDWRATPGAGGELAGSSNREPAAPSGRGGADRDPIVAQKVKDSVKAVFNKRQWQASEVHIQRLADWVHEQGFEDAVNRHGVDAFAAIAIPHNMWGQMGPPRAKHAVYAPQATPPTAGGYAAPYYSAPFGGGGGAALPGSGVGALGPWPPTRGPQTPHEQPFPQPHFTPAAQPPQWQPPPAPQPAAAPQPPIAPTPAPSTTVASELAALKEMRAFGVITEEAFRRGMCQIAQTHGLQ